MNATGKRQFPHVAAWGDSAGCYAVMPIEFRKEDCYILLDSDDQFGIYRNTAEEPFMPEDMIFTGNADGKYDHELTIYIKMLQMLRDSWLV